MHRSKMTTAPTGCTICRGRVVSGDRVRSKKYYTTCSRPTKKSQGYSLRLSWPRPNDRRRAVVLNSVVLSPSPRAAGQISDARFVHTSNWDIELYYSSISPVPVRSLSSLSVPVSWNPSRLEILDRDLLEYFCCVASTSLATFGQDTTALGNKLVQIALQEDTATATAVLQGLLAFSSLHRYGVQSQALELKIAAIGNLTKASAVSNLGAKSTTQHVATGMLLCSFEIHQSSFTSGQWISYLGGVRTVLNASSNTTLSQISSEAAILLDWVHYHEVLARFSLMHWKREGTSAPASTPIDLFPSKASNLLPPIFSMLDLLSQVCDTVFSDAISRSNLDDYKGFLEILDWRIRSLPMPKVPDGSNVVSDDATLGTQLFQLAMLLFLNRSFEGLMDQPIRIKQHVDKAFTILPRMSSCKQQFPIYIIGSEARTDEQRAIVLDIISRTEKKSSSRSLNHCQRIVQAIWAQDDLANGINISYRERLTSVVSRCLIVPSFV